MVWVERLVLSLTCSKPLGESLKFSVHLFLHLSSKDSTNIDVDFGNDSVNHLEECHIVSVMQTLAIHIFT